MELYPGGRKIIQITALYSTDRKIQKVPERLRKEDNNRGTYDPKAVSFGPYHHGNPELKTCEEMKQFTLQIFVEGGYQTPQFYYHKILEQIPYAQSCYVEDSTNKYSNDQLAEMMLLDSCFLIWLIIGIRLQNRVHWLHIYNHLGSLVFTLAYEDIYLMENQIPFQILMLLINLRYENGEEHVSKFLYESIWAHYKHQEEKENQEEIQDIKQQQQQNQPLHLFEAFHSVLVCDLKKRQEKEKTDLLEALRRFLVCDLKKNREKEKTDFEKEKEETDLKKRQEKEKTDLKKHHKTFRSATDLKAKGIHFRSSSRKSLKAICFDSYKLYGKLYLPTWIVSRLSKVFFPNMIAYELCPNISLIDTTVISYINFMKSLIDSPADVKELRDKKIFLIELGCDEDVVEFYKNLDTYGMENTDTYEVVNQRIQDHYDSRGKTWMAELINTYFSRPWSIIAWFAGVVLIALTVVQTRYTVNPK